MENKKEKLRRWSYWFILGLALIIVFKCLDNFTSVMEVIGDFLNIVAPFFVGVFIAYILYIPCRKFETAFRGSKIKLIKRRARTLSIITVYLIVALILIILTSFILPVVWDSVIDFVGNIQYYYETAIDRYNSLPEDSIIKSEQVNEFIESIQHIDLREYFNFDRVMEYISSAISAVTGIFDIFVAVIVSIYVLAERGKILAFVKKFAEAIFKERTYKNIDKYYNHSNEIFFKFIASQFLDAVVVGILTSIAMSIMGIKYAVLLGFFIGLFNMIPFIGAIIAVGISAIITLITGGLSQAIWMLIVVIILQQIDANIINPKIVGKSLEISPILVLLAVTIGGAYFGILGMFLAVPIVGIIKILVEDFVDYRLAVKKASRLANNSEDLIEENIK